MHCTHHAYLVSKRNVIFLGTLHDLEIALNLLPLTLELGVLGHCARLCLCSTLRHFVRQFDSYTVCQEPFCSTATFRNHDLALRTTWSTTTSRRLLLRVLFSGGRRVFLHQELKFFDQRPKEAFVHMLTSPESLQAFIVMVFEGIAQVVGHFLHA
jgi:hypothetical protein